MHPGSPPRNSVSPSDRDLLDPVFLRSRREACLILAVWGGCLVWCVGYCRLFGYAADPMLPIFWGMPRWIAVGVFIPWMVATLISIFIGLFVVRDQPLGDPDGSSEELTQRESG